MTSLYGSKAMPRQVFGEGRLLDVFYRTMRASAPAAWELNEAFLAMWDAAAHEHSWVLPDNFHVRVKVMSQVKEVVHFLNEPFDVYRSENAPTAEGRSLGANTIHSIDGMIVRELTRRCDYDPEQIIKLMMLVETWGVPSGSKPDLTLGETFSEDDQRVLTLWGHYEASGYLSARILDHLNVDNIAYVDAGPVRELLDSLPKKPFKVVSIHQWWM